MLSSLESLIELRQCIFMQHSKHKWSFTHSEATAIRKMHTSSGGLAKKKESTPRDNVRAISGPTLQRDVTR